jgi:peptidoglycan/LPS O-acetylase OafA/YrhL
MSERIINRVIPLDWLRGLCAISIMLFHFYFVGKNDLLFGKLNIYAVSTFFIISGLSMAIVYNHYIKGIKESFIFLSKRIFRIMPLYLILCIFTVVFVNKETKFNINDFLLNITGLFTFVKSTRGGIVPGGWSIGNEMCYYLLTPIILYVYDRKTLYGNIIFAITVAIGLYFAFHLMTPNNPSSIELSSHPLNNLFLFVAGIAIYYNFNSIKSIKYYTAIICLSISFVVFLIYPYHEQIDLVTGITRVVLVLIVTLWCFIFFKMKVDKISVIGRIFETFGLATYGVYIMHILVRIIINYTINKLLHFNLSSFIISALSVCITIAIAIVSYYRFEIKISNWGKYLVKKIVK